MEVASIILRTQDVEQSTAFWSDVVRLSITSQIPGYTFLETGLGRSRPTTGSWLESETSMVTNLAPSDQGLVFRPL